jgi:anaerobic selenocysteine-containing dehydrogenase
MCAKGNAVRQILYHPERLNHPLKRTRPKGDPDPGWQRITWDEALDTIAQRLLRYKEEFGAESVCFGFGTGRETNQYCFRITNTFGTPNRTGVTNLCTGPQSSASRTVWGGGMHGIEPDFVQAQCIVLWGFNPSHSIPGQAQFILDAQERGAKLIVVDPLFTPLASKADMWLPLRPGTDGALALSWMHVIVQEELYDKQFVTRWSNGPFLVRSDNGKLLVEADLAPEGDPQKFMVWDEAQQRARPHDAADLTPALSGSFQVQGIPCRTAWDHFTDRLSDYSPEYVAEVTWLPAEQIREAARAYAKARPAALGMHLGVTHHSNAFQNNLALNQLVGLCGNLDVPGGNVDWPVGIARWFAMGWPALEALPPGQAEKRLGAKEAPFLSAGVFACAHYTKVWEAILTGKPYPVKAMVTVASNILSAVENPREAREALQKLEFFVVMDYFMTPTAQLADIVLPAAHWTERDNLSEEVCKNFITARPRVIDPMYERWPDEKFYNELAKRLGLEGYWQWKDVAEILDWELREFGITWEQMKERYILEVPKKYRSYTEGGFRTPTKRVELYSTTLGRLGFDPLPYFEEPFYSPQRAPELARQYPLVLTAGGRIPGYYHSAYRGIPWLRELAPEPEISIHPQTAADLGLEEGDWAWVETAMGRIKQKVRLFQGIHPRVVQIHHGWWQGCKELGHEGYGWDGANANILIDNKRNDPYTGTPDMRSTLCRVYKA